MNEHEDISVLNNNKNAWHTEWQCSTNKENSSFLLYKRDSSVLHLKIGDWVKIPGRDDIVLIDSIIGRRHQTNITGPIGFTYLPWRYNERRFATISWSMKGNSRFIICYPCGNTHYGVHIDWDKFELCEAPDNINLDLVNKVLVNNSFVLD